MKGFLYLVVSATSVGTAWIFDVTMSVFLVASLFLPQRFRMPLMTIFSGLVLCSLALTGHAMMHEGWLGYVHQANDVIHVLSAGFWIGGLIPLAIIMHNMKQSQRIEDHVIALKRFSMVGEIAVGLLVISGLINTFLIIGGWPVHWSSSYQLLLCIKIGLVILMISLASRNRFFLTPRLTRDRQSAAIAIRNAAIVEFAMGLATIGLVALFGFLDPGMPG